MSDTAHESSTGQIPPEAVLFRLVVEFGPAFADDLNMTLDDFIATFRDNADCYGHFGAMFSQHAQALEDGNLDQHDVGSKHRNMAFAISECGTCVDMTGVPVPDSYTYELGSGYYMCAVCNNQK